MKDKHLHKSEKEIQIWVPALKGSLIGLFLLLLLFPVSGDIINQGLPCILVPLAGAVGGIFYAVVNGLDLRSGRHSILANFFSVLLYIFLLVIAFAMSMNTA